MIYNFNLGIGWASSGVEYAQAYRAHLLRSAGIEAKFVFTDMFPRENIEHMTKNIGFLDSEILWLYTFFTDTRISPVTYTLQDFEKTIANKDYHFSRDGKIAKYVFPGQGNFYTCYLVDDTSDGLHRVEYVAKGCLIRKDYFTYCRIYSEYFAPLDQKAHMYHRRFFHENGSVAYEEFNDDGNVFYQFPDRLIGSKEELVGYMVSRLNLTERDVVIIDRTTGIGQAILENTGLAKVGIVIHADHFSEGSTDDENILWNNFYEYAFSQHRHIAFYVTATDAQNALLREHFKYYMKAVPAVFTIPVGSLDELKHPSGERRKHALITASRLAREKHIDWIIDAVVKARREVPDLTLDIYGEGREAGMLRKRISDYGAADYIRLMGQYNLSEVYQVYDAYISGSTSEGFGLTLMEAIGSGLPVIGFDVRYGNPTFIDHEKNGYLIPVNDRMDDRKRVQGLYQSIIKLFTEADIEAFHQHSYKKAEQFLTNEVESKWVNLFKEII